MYTYVHLHKTRNIAVRNKVNMVDKISYTVFWIMEKDDFLPTIELTVITLLVIIYPTVWSKRPC